MQRHELHKLARDARAGLAAGFTGYILAGVGVWTATGSRREVIGPALGAATSVAVISMAIGVAGATVRAVKQAGILGAAMLGLPAGIAIPLFPLGIREGIWLWAAICSFGSITAQVGAVAGGSLADRNVSPQRRQFTLGQMLAFFVPVAIFFGYVTHFPKP